MPNANDIIKVPPILPPQILADGMEIALVVDIESNNNNNNDQGAVLIYFLWMQREGSRFNGK